ncbi:MAG: hypothetical protein V4474_02620 [Patescibacteria group bacterium]
MVRNAGLPRSQGHKQGRKSVPREPQKKVVFTNDEAVAGAISPGPVDERSTAEMMADESAKK